jgi:hypothetical protein
MLTRRALVLALAAASFACTDAKQDGAPEELVTVALYSPPRDPQNCAAPPAAPSIPLPNDVALQRVHTLPDGLQKELLLSFIGNGGWPSDQATPITLPIFRRTRNAATGAYVAAVGPSGLDTTTLDETRVAVLRIEGTTVERVPFTASYTAPAAGAPAGTPGVLRITPTGSRWAAGSQFVAAIRGGDHGVKTSNGTPLGADSPIALIAPDKDLSIKEYQPLGAIPDSACSAPGTADEIATLETLRRLYGQPQQWGQVADVPTCTDVAGGAPCWLPGEPPAAKPSAFDAVATVFPHEEIASIQTFSTSGGTRPVTDAAGGTVPLPSDFLLDPTTGKVRNVPAFGAAAAGLATLDGFSTTATHLVPLSGPVSAAPASVNGNNLRIYELTPGGPVKLRDQSALPGNTPQIVTQPPQFNSDVGGQPVTTTLALAPAVPLPVNPTTVVPVPPLKERTRYLVIVTNDVLDVAGAPLKRSTLMDILFTLESPIYSNGGTPSDPSDDINYAAGLGLSNADAAGLQAMRDGLSPALTALGLKSCSGGARCAVLAYTVTTQSNTGVSLQLAAAPYSVEVGGGQAVFTPTAATPVSAPPGVPTASVAGFYSVTFNSVDAIDKTTGALRPTLAADLADPAVLPTLLAPLTALVAVPEAAAVPACPSPPFPAGARCAKVVIFGHGLNGSKETLFAVASSLASQGFIAAAIDFPLQGSRNWCSANSDCTTDGTADGVCTPFEGANQGDATPPGLCTEGVPRAAPSRYFITSNFFRTRDAFRQNVLDQSALALALSRPPASQGIPQPPGNPFTAVLPAGVITDPSAVYYEGLSLGSIAGTSVVATNPRISRTVLSVGGGTVTDVFTQSPAFAESVDALFATLIPGYTRAAITPGDPAFDPAIAQSYVRTLSVAKWILDPADPLNYAVHVRTSPLPDLLANPNGSVPQTAKETFSQMALGDTVVLNPFSIVLNSLTAGNTVTYVDTDPAGGPVPHGMLAQIPEVQVDAAQYLVDTTFPASPRAVPVP